MSFGVRWLLMVLTVLQVQSVLARESTVTLPDNVTVIVSKSPLDTHLPQFRTVSEALKARSFLDPSLIANEKTAQKPGTPFVIFIRRGTYNERVVIDDHNIKLIGEQKESTIISYGRYAGQRVDTPEQAKIKKNWGTGRTATVEINGSAITLTNLTVKNTFDFLSNEQLADDDTNKVRGTQAVALKTGLGADKIFLNNVALWGYQDTLYLNGDRAYIKGGMVAGNIDFIFGGGTAVFDGVTLLSRQRGKEVNEGYAGYITAPSTLISRPFGFVFIGCTLAREKGVPQKTVALGRPWHPTTTFADGRYANPYAVGNSTFIRCNMDSHIAKHPWTSMSGTQKDGSKRAFSPLTEARFSEYGSLGPGAERSAQGHTVLNEKEASFYSIEAILREWKPKE